MLASILRSTRIKKRYSVRGLSRCVGISDTELNRIESGERQNINMIVLIKLCEELDIDFIKLLVLTKYLSSDYNKYLDEEVQELLNSFETDEITIKIYSSNDIERTNSPCEKCEHYCSFLNVCIIDKGEKNEKR